MIWDDMFNSESFTLESLMGEREFNQSRYQSSRTVFQILKNVGWKVIIYNIIQIFIF